MTHADLIQALRTLRDETCQELFRCGDHPVLGVPTDIVGRWARQIDTILAGIAQSGEQEQPTYPLGTLVVDVRMGLNTFHAEIDSALRPRNFDDVTACVLGLSEHATEQTNTADGIHGNQSPHGDGQQGEQGHDRIGHVPDDVARTAVAGGREAGSTPAGSLSEHADLKASIFHVGDQMIVEELSIRLLRELAQLRHWTTQQVADTRIGKRSHALMLKTWRRIEAICPSITPAQWNQIAEQHSSSGAMASADRKEAL